jgi:hypothetical protein
MAKMKAYPTFDDYLMAQSLENRGILRELRAFVKKTAPKLVESVKWGNGCWLKGKVPVAYVYAERAWVQFGFMLGSKLDDPRGLLEGSGRFVRHVKVFDPAEFYPDYLAKLLRQAIAATPERLSDLGKGPARGKAKARKAPAKTAPRAKKKARARKTKS